MFLKSYYSPSSSSLLNSPEGVFLYRNQWTGFQPTNDADLPSQFFANVFSISTPLENINSGLGLRFLSENFGPLRRTDVSIGYSYKIKLKRDLRISAGVFIGLLQKRYEADYRPPVTLDDDKLIELQNSNANSSEVDLSFSSTLSYREFEVSVIINHLQANQNKLDPININDNLGRHLYSILSYKYSLNRKYSIQPNVFFKSDLQTISYDLGALMYYKADKYWSGFSYRDQADLSIFLGLGALKGNSLKIGYSIDLVLLNREAKSSTSHEIIVTYRLPPSLNAERPIINTPRFNY